MKNIQREINVGPRVMQAIYYKYTGKKETDVGAGGSSRWAVHYYR